MQLKMTILAMIAMTIISMIMIFMMTMIMAMNHNHKNRKAAEEVCQRVLGIEVARIFFLFTRKEKE